MADREKFGRMSVLPVSELVGNDSFNFSRSGLFDQRIENDNVLGPGKTVKVGIRVSGSLASVNHIEMLEREPE